MYIFKEAYRNVYRNKGRNVLVGLIIFILISASVVALIINTTTGGIIDDYKAEFGSSVYINIDFDKLMKEAQEKDSNDGVFTFPTVSKPITNKQYMTFTKSEYLKSSTTNSTVGIVFDGIKAIDEDKAANNGMVSSIGDGTEEYVSPTAIVHGYSDLSQDESFQTGRRKLIEGEFALRNGQVNISKELALFNGLSLGDSVTIVNSMNKDQKISLEIVGIYLDSSIPEGNPSGSFSLGGSLGNKKNDLLIATDTLIENFDSNSFEIYGTYVLKAPHHLRAFEAELREKGLSDDYIVRTDSDSYHQIVAPVEGLSKIVFTIITVVLGVGSLILLFVTTITIRERKYEIGVLRALGFKKNKLTRLFVYENLVISSIALILAFGVGSLAAQPIADKLIANQISSIKESGLNQNGNGSINIGTSNTDPRTITSVEVALSSEAIIQISIIALSLAAVSSMVGVIYISKYEPMKILSERN